MPDGTMVTQTLGAFFRRRSRDKCLKDFSENQVTFDAGSG